MHDVHAVTLSLQTCGISLPLVTNSQVCDQTLDELYSEFHDYHKQLWALRIDQVIVDARLKTRLPRNISTQSTNYVFVLHTSLRDIIV
jgi:hypothetical protein